MSQSRSEPSTSRTALTLLWVLALGSQLSSLGGWGLLALLTPGLLGRGLGRVHGWQRGLWLVSWAALYNGLLHQWSVSYGWGHWLLLVLIRTAPWLLLWGTALIAERSLKGEKRYLNGLIFGLGYGCVQFALLAGPFGCDWDSLPAALVPWPWLLSLLPQLGISGLTALLATLSYWLLAGASSPRAVAGCLGTLWVLYSWSQASEAPGVKDRVLLEVGAVHTSWPQNLRWDSRYRGAFKEALADLSRLPKTDPELQSLKLVVWPETSWPVLGMLNRIRERKEVAEIADLAGRELLVGSIEPAPEGSYNSATLFQPERGAGPTYRKRRLFPFGEYIPLPEPLRTHYLQWRPFTAGHHLSPGDPGPPFETAIGRVEIMICFESTVPRSTSEGGPPDLLVVMTNDAPLDSNWTKRAHLHSSILRAVTSGRPLVQSANHGYTALVRSDGVIAALLGPEDRAALLTVGGPLR